jgi:uncharacterized protein YhfF
MTLDELNAALRLDGPPCRFGSRGEMRRELTELVVAGTKTATAALLAEYEAERDEVPVVGTRSPVIDDDEQVIGVLVTTRVEHLPLEEVFWEFADAEGEGFTDVDDWRTQHERFWNRHSVPLVRELLDPTFALDDATVVVCEWFSFEPLDVPVAWPGEPELTAG